MKYFLVFIFYSSGLVGIDYINQSAIIEKQLIQEVCQEYGMRISGSGGGYMAEYNNVSVVFDYPGPVSISQAREMFVKIKEKFANRINECCSLRPYLHRYPFSASEDVKIQISFFNFNDRKKYTTSEVDLIGFGQGKVWYTKYDNNKCFGRDVLVEPYEEAKAIVLK